jgi:hypothetical protein
MSPVLQAIYWDISFDDDPSKRTIMESEEGTYLICCQECVQLAKVIACPCCRNMDHLETLGIFNFRYSSSNNMKAKDDTKALDKKEYLMPLVIDCGCIAPKQRT